MNLKYLNTQNIHANQQFGSASPQKRGQGLAWTRTGGCSARDAAKLHQRGMYLPKAHVHRRHKHTPEPQAGWTCWCGLAQGHLICGHLQTLHIHSKCSSYSTQSLLIVIPGTILWDTLIVRMIF